MARLVHNLQFIAGPLRNTGRLVTERLESRLLLSGTSYLVDSLADNIDTDGLITLREAISAANTNAIVGDAAAGSSVDADMIEFAPSLFAGGAQAITLDGGELEIFDNIVITGPSSDQLSIDAASLSRIFNVTENISFTLSGVTLKNGRADGSSGGAIAGLLGNPSQGNYGSEIVINDVIVTDNFADFSGGGIIGGTLRIADSEIVSNLSGNFAGIYGIDVQIISSTVSLNRSADSSGGVFGANLGLINSVITANHAVRYGGGVYCNNLTAINSTIAGNYAGLDGGGIYCRNGSATVVNSIITANDGGDISGDFTIETSIIAVDPHFASDPDHGGDGWGDDPATAAIDESANDFTGDLHLISTSSAIDFGNTAASVDFDGLPLVLDADGLSRFVGSSVDCGAYEFASPPAGGKQVPSVTVNTASDNFDLYDSAISLREAVWYVQTGQLAGNIIDFDADMSGQTITLGGRELFVMADTGVDASLLAEPVSIGAGGQSRVILADRNVSLTLKNLEITGGTAANGAGIYLRGAASLAAVDLTLINNQATEFGGGIYAAADAMINISGGNFAGNSSLWSGGAIYGDNAGSIQISASEFTENSAGEFGYGGAVGATGSDIDISSSVFKYNRSEAGGGAIGLWGSALYAASLEVFGNSSITGGGIYQWFGTAYLSNSVFVGNSADSGGAVSSDYQSSLTIVNCTMAENEATGPGGALWADQSGMQINNSIVWLNSSGSGSDIFGSFGSSHNLIGIDPLFLSDPSDGGDGWGDDLATTQIDEAANDFFGDLRLAPRSPAIDSGNTSLAVDAQGVPLAVDIRGAGRNSGSSVDIGAYEFRYIPGDADGNETVNIFDFLVLKSNYGAGSASWADGDFDGNGTVDIFDFLILKSNYGF